MKTLQLFSEITVIGI